MKPATLSFKFRRQAGGARPMAAAAAACTPVREVRSNGTRKGACYFLPSSLPAEPRAGMAPRRSDKLDLAHRCGVETTPDLRGGVEFNHHTTIALHRRVFDACLGFPAFRVVSSWC